MRIPDLSSYLLSELPTTLMTQGSLKDQVVERLSWLAPEETDTVMGNGTDYVDWEKGIPILLGKVDMISADEGGEEEDEKRLVSTPLWIEKLVENLEDSESRLHIPVPNLPKQAETHRVGYLEGMF